MHQTKYGKIQEMAVDLGRIKSATSYSLRSIKTTKPKKIIAEVIGSYQGTLYRKIANNNFKPWEIINLVNFLLSFFEHHCKSLNANGLNNKPNNHIKVIRYRLDTKINKLHKLYYDYYKIRYEISRSLRNLSPQEVLPKYALAKLLDIGLSSYHRKANQKNFKTEELIEIIFFLVRYFDSHFQEDNF
ncbi:MAG: hypothetical protein ACOCQ4_03330 [bacterium]